MKIKVYPACLFAALFLSLSCSKDNTTPQADLLTAHSWKIQSIIETPGLRYTSRDTAYTDLSPDEPCDMDNALQFYKDGTVSLSSGVLHCTSNEVASLTGAWHFVNDGEKMYLYLKGAISSFGYNYDTVLTIHELSASRMKLSYNHYWDWTNKIHTREIVFVK